jgi:cytochrome c biogenesis protein
VSDQSHTLSASPTEEDLGFRLSRGAALLDRVWYTFSSIKFALGLLLILTVGSFIGMMIPQAGTEQEYAQKYGEFWKNVVLFWQMDRCFRSWWYVTLEVLIGASITVCSINRLPVAWRMAFRPVFLQSASSYDTMPIRARIPARAGATEASEALRVVLRRFRYRVSERRADDGAAVLYAGATGQVARMLPYVIHIGLLTILLGGVVGALYSFSVPANARSGESVAVPGFPNEAVRVDSFFIEVNDRGEVRDYVSLTTVLRDGKPYKTKRIEVNEPLEIHGINYYQATYSQDPERVDFAQVRLVRGPEGKELERLSQMPPMQRIQEQLRSPQAQQEALTEAVVLPFGRMTPVSGTPFSARLARYVADFQVDPATREVSTRSGDPNNPAVLCELWQGDRKLYEDWVFLNSDIHLVPSPVQFQLMGLKPTLITGFQVAKNPGAPLLLVGFVVFGLGLLPMMFLYTHRQVFARVEESERGAVVRLSGRTYKNRRGFESHFWRVAEALGSALHAKADIVTPGDEPVPRSPGAPSRGHGKKGAATGTAPLAAATGRVTQ